MNRLEPHPEPDLDPNDVLYVDAFGSRNWPSFTALAFLMLMFAPLVITNSVPGWLFLPYSVTVTGLLIWCSFCIATDQHWKVTVTRKRVTWDRLFSSTPVFVHVAEIDAIRADKSEPGCVIDLFLKNGTRVRIPPSVTSWIDHERLFSVLELATAAARNTGRA